MKLSQTIDADVRYTFFLKLEDEMKLSDDLVTRIETALEPIDGETAQHLMLGRDGRIAMSTLKQYKTAQETFEVIVRRADNGAPQTKQRSLTGLKATIDEEILSLERQLRKLSRRTDKFEVFDPAALANLANEVKQIIGVQYQVRR